jgi:hypothetical protein
MPRNNRRFVMPGLDQPRPGIQAGAHAAAASSSVALRAKVAPSPSKDGRSSNAPSLASYSGERVGISPRADLRDGSKVQVAESEPTKAAPEQQRIEMKRAVL